MKKILMATATAVALGLGANAFAQDCSGTPSTGAADQTCSTTVSLTIDPAVAIGSLATTLPLTYAVGGSTGSATFCLGSNSGTGVIISSGSGDSGTGGEFRMNDQLLYTAQINSIALVENGDSALIATVDSLADCVGGGAGTATLQVDTSQAAQDAVDAGSYDDVLTLLVTPQ
jgi:hypothetical protein